MRLLLACLVVLVAPAVASAGVVSSTQFGGFSFQASPGEVNQVTVHDLVVSDAGAPLAAGPGCVPVDAHTASCNPPLQCRGYYSYTSSCPIGAELGDGDDVIDADTRYDVAATGGVGDDRLLGGDGSDYLVGGPGADFMQGRGGTDAVDYSEPDRSGGVVVRIDDAPGDGALGEGDDARSEVIFGTPEADRLVGNDVDNYIDGRGGADRIACRGGVDTVYIEHPRRARSSCETVIVDELSARLKPMVDGPLKVRGGGVTVKVDPDTYGPWAATGEVQLSTGGGRRLGSIAVQIDEPVDVGIPLTRRAQRLLKRRGELTVRVTGTVPNKSVIRVLARLRA